ncbi:LAME_0A07074g1_1 [Lachancea meyersii CBS 8951]|uniref:LAME_0A07074g1_1 n=1 Tax=Lachancea meyersii CBS 8951 TaxID=1266667 RepID=A0A1G4IQL1_9SACH|nr:LAME_0A07074g1_1 [Lachancea meyersii CBS 8951]
MNSALMRRPGRTIWRNEQDVLLVSLLTEYRSLLNGGDVGVRQHSARTRKQFWDLIARELTVRYHVVRNPRQCKDRFRLLYTRGIRNMHNGVDPQTGVDALCLELNRIFYLDLRNNIALAQDRPDNEQPMSSGAGDDGEYKDRDEVDDTCDEITLNDHSRTHSCSQSRLSQELPHNSTHILADPGLDVPAVPLLAHPSAELPLPQAPPAPFAPDYQDPQIQMLMDQVLMLDQQVADLYARLDELGHNTDRRFARVLDSERARDPNPSSSSSATTAAAASVDTGTRTRTRTRPSAATSTSTTTTTTTAAGTTTTTTANNTPETSPTVLVHPQSVPQFQRHYEQSLASAFRPAFPPPVPHHVTSQPSPSPPPPPPPPPPLSSSAQPASRQGPGSSASPNLGSESQSTTHPNSLS